MSRHIHLNLILDEEIVSSSPVRSQIVAPVLIAAITVSVFAWWVYLFTAHLSLKRLNASNIELNKVIQPAYKRVLALADEEKEMTALNAQLEAFNHSKLRYGRVLSRIPEHVDPNVQFTMMKVAEPPPPILDDKKPGNGPTNTFERAEFMIAGKAAGSKAFDAVNQLLKALNTDAYTNLIENAVIPKGSFRQDPRSRDDSKEFVLFEIKCRCRPRRFK